MKNGKAMTDPEIRHMFQGAGDFIARELQCGEWTLFAYAIDGLVSGGDLSDYVIKPITEHLTGDTPEML